MTAAKTGWGLGALFVGAMACTSLLGNFETVQNEPDAGAPAPTPPSDGGGRTSDGGTVGQDGGTCKGPDGGAVYVGFPCSISEQGVALNIPNPVRGRCKVGRWVCDALGTAVCVGAVGPTKEVCSTSGTAPDDDEDCDGNAVNGCPCRPGEVIACGRTIGECRAGEQRCDNAGNWGACTATNPQIRNCGSDKDNDCNGVVDNTECFCPPNVVVGGRQGCAASAPGNCAAGNQTCIVSPGNPSAVVWGPCTPGTPGPPLCTQAVDNDCDGVLDYRESGCICRGGTSSGYQAPRDTFANGMYGCPGAVDFAGRANLCNGTCQVCTAAQWNQRRNKPPTHHYWTNDQLGYQSGPVICTTTHSCSVSTSTDGGYAFCSNMPMRVCAASDAGCGGATDTSGNLCNWHGCGYETLTNQYFGGCSGNTTAGTLCCCN